MPKTDSTPELTDARTAIEHIAELGVAPSARNYEVALAYVLDAKPGLRADMNALKGSQPPSQVVLDDLHARYFSDATAASQMLFTGEQIARELSGVVQAMAQADTSAGDYGKILAATSDSLSQGLDASALQSVIANLAAATKEMRTSNQALTQRLAESSAEIDSLRQVLKEARAESLTDGLTGLANRRYFDEVLAMRLHEANGGRLCLIMCDIDHFKRFNDTYGHQTGDQVIRFVASVLTATAKGDQLAARYGGEEFAMICPRTSIEEAHELAQNIRKRVEAKRLVRKSTQEELGRVTISMGAALWEPGESTASLIERADAALYQSKRAGRNRVTLADPKKQADRSAA